MLEGDPSYELDREEFRKEDQDASGTPEIRPPQWQANASDLKSQDSLQDRGYGENRVDPDYWRSRAKPYEAAIALVVDKSPLDCAKRHAQTYRKKLASFPEGRAILRNKDPGDSVVDPKCWLGKKEHYYSEYKRLVKHFRNCCKSLGSIGKG